MDVARSLGGARQRKQCAEHGKQDRNAQRASRQWGFATAEALALCYARWCGEQRAAVQFVNAAPMCQGVAQRGSDMAGRPERATQHEQRGHCRKYFLLLTCPSTHRDEPNTSPARHAPKQCRTLQKRRIKTLLFMHES